MRPLVCKATITPASSEDLSRYHVPRHWPGDFVRVEVTTPELGHQIFLEPKNHVDDLLAGLSVNDVCYKYGRTKRGLHLLQRLLQGLGPAKSHYKRRRRIDVGNY